MTKQELAKIILLSQTETIEFLGYDDVWKIKTSGKWDESNSYRIKPKTISIGPYDVPEPLRVAPPIGTRLYIPNPAYKRTCIFHWDDSEMMHADWLKWGLCHLDEGGAQTHLDALLSFTKQDS